VRGAGIVATIAAVRKSKIDRVKALPWAALLQAGMVAVERWRGLSQKDRASLARLLRQSRGRAHNLSARERKELRRLSGKLDIKGLGRQLLPLLRGRSKGRKRR
jgi:hypothetical protein